MVIDFPSEITAEPLGNSGGAVAAVHGRVMLKAVLADHVHQIGKSRYVDNGASSKGLQRIVGEFTLADVGANPTVYVVSAYAPEGEWARIRAPFERSEGILFTECGAENGRGGDAYFRQEILCPVAAMKENTLVGVAP